MNNGSFSSRANLNSGLLALQQKYDLAQINNLELGNDLVYTYLLHATEKYFVITIKDLKSDKLANGFFNELLKINLFDEDFQPRIVGYQKESDLIRFVIERDPDDILLTEIDLYEDYHDMKINEKLWICIKLVEFLYRFEKTLEWNEYFNSFLYMTYDNIVFNLRTKSFKLLFYPFELALLKSGIPNNQIKLLRTPFLPFECFKFKQSEIVRDKLNSYIVGCILINFLTKKIPWVENDSDVIKESILNQDNLAKMDLTKHFLRESLNTGELSDENLDQKINQILEIIGFCCDPKQEQRKNLKEIFNLTKALIPNLDLISCERCISDIKEISSYYCSSKNILICKTCIRPVIKGCCGENEFSQNHITITSLENEVNNLRYDNLDLSSRKKEKNFVEIYSNIRGKLDDNTKQVKAYVNNYEKFKSIIEKLNNFNEQTKTSFILNKKKEEKLLNIIEEKYRYIEALKLKELDKFENQISNIEEESLNYENSYQSIKKNKLELEKITQGIENIDKNITEFFSDYYQSIDKKIVNENSLMNNESSKLDKLLVDIDDIIEKGNSDIILPDNLSKDTLILQELELKEEENFEKFNSILVEKIEKIKKSTEIPVINKQIFETPY